MYPIKRSGFKDFSNSYITLYSFSPIKTFTNTKEKMFKCYILYFLIYLCNYPMLLKQFLNFMFIISENTGKQFWIMLEVKNSSLPCKLNTGGARRRYVPVAAMRYAIHYSSVYCVYIGGIAATSYVFYWNKFPMIMKRNIWKTFGNIKIGIK